MSNPLTKHAAIHRPTVRSLGQSRRFLFVLIAAAYGVVLAALPLDVFKDHDNYLSYASYSRTILRNYWDMGAPGPVLQ